MKPPPLAIALFLLPTLALFGLIYLVPIAVVGVTSFTEWNGFGDLTFIGLANYQQLAADRQFQLAMRNSVLWGLCAALIHVPFGVLIALYLHRRPFGWRFVRSASLLPNLVPPPALALMYIFLFNPGIGLINEIIRRLGFPDFEVYWFFEPETAFIAVTSVWVLYAGVIVLLTMAELSRIPPELREAALIDGATDRQVEWNIYVPLLKNIIAVGLIIAVTDVFKMFDYVYLTTNGGPNDQTMSLGLMIFNQATIRYEYGYSNAVGVVLLIMGLVTFYGLARLFRMNDPVA
jgi:raffinose/stachyose/melibiose transport system permease protein